MTIVLVALVLIGVVLLCIAALWLWYTFSQLKATMQALVQELHHTREQLHNERLRNNNTHPEGGTRVLHEERRASEGVLRDES